MLAWFLKRAEELNLQVYRDQELSRFLPGVHDYLVTITLEGEEIWGRGSHQDIDLALQAACAEVVERASLLLYRKRGFDWTSNGIAAHSSLQSAKDGAIAELIERDAYLAHYLTNTPFSALELTPELRSIQAGLDVKGIELKIRRLVSPRGWNVALAACFGTKAEKPFGVFIGASCKLTLESAVAKAVKESVTLVTGFLRKEVSYQENFNGPLFHHRLAALPPSADLMKSFFRMSVGRAETPIDLSEIQFEVLDKHPVLASCPLTVVRATNLKAQTLFFGPTREHHINLGRLKHFLGKEIAIEDVNRTTHLFV